MTCFCRFMTVLMSFILTVTGIANPQKPDEPKPEVEKMNITSDYIIVHGENAFPSEVNAANKLQFYLEEISGIKIPVVTDSTASAEKEIIVGKTNREGSDYTVDREKLGTEGIMMKTVGEKIVLSGGETRGTLYCVYEFLYKYFDCRWYSADVKVIPKADTLSVPKNIDYTFVPTLEYRETDWISPRDTEFSIANHLNANTYRTLSNENGGTFGYANSFAHTMASLIPVSLFDENPEMFALGVKNDKRTVDQPCLTNPKTLETAINSVRAILEKNPDQIVCVTQNDNQNYCVCENCKKIDEEEGSHAGTMIRFVNSIAENIAEDYPNAVIDTFAYQYTRQAPKISKPLPNVIVRICSIECCFSHSLGDPECEQNALFKKDMEDWQKICNRIYVWDYTTNYSNYNGPFPDFGVLQDNMKFFAENNAKGIYEEGNYTASESNGEFADLRAYLLSRLLWDPYMENYEEEMIGFCNAYYGEAGKYIKQYIDLTTKNTGTKYFFITQHMTIYRSMTDKSVLNMNEAEVHMANALWEKAKTADLTEEQFRRVRLSEISWRYWKACNLTCEFTWAQIPPCRAKENKKLYDDMKELGITRIHEGNGGVLSDDPNFFKKPNEWT